MLNINLSKWLVECRRHGLLSGASGDSRSQNVGGWGEQNCLEKMIFYSKKQVIDIFSKGIGNPNLFEALPPGNAAIKVVLVFDYS